MRRRKVILFCSAVVTMMSACTQGKTDSEPTEGVMGEVIISLSAEGQSLQSKAAVEVGVPEAEDFAVEIFKMTDLGRVRLYKDSYLNTKDCPIKLNCADYKLVAHYGDSLGVGENQAYFEAVEPFTLAPYDRHKEISAVARVSNVRVAVEYGENLKYDYLEYYSIIWSETPGGRKKSVQFYQDETEKKVFVPYGTLYYELYAKIDGQWKYFPAQPVVPEKGDDITFKVETSKVQGQQEINVVVSSPEKEDKSFEIPSAALPSDAPSLSSEIPSLVQLHEGQQPLSELRMNIVADGNIKECWLNIDSDYLSALGLPERVDLASENMTEQVKTALQSVGVKWMKSMAGRRFAYVDFSGLTRYICENQCDPDNLLDATFSIDVVDCRHKPGQTGHTGTVSSESYRFLQGVPAPSITLHGFESGPVGVLEGTGVTMDGLTASVVAKGRIGNCYLDIVSPYLVAQGIPSRVDLANIDQATAQKLRSSGISWPSDMSSHISAEIDFSGLTAYMERSMYSAAYGEKFATLTLTVKNAVTLDPQDNEEKSANADFKYLLPAATVTTIHDYNVWAKKIYDFSVNLTAGNPQLVKLQYSVNGGPWTDITANTTLDGTVLTCSKLATSANTVYDIRAIYNNNPDLWIGFNQVRTEAEEQIPNSDFETWTEEVHEFTRYGYSPNYYTWHRPYGGNVKGWDINAKISMPSKDTGLTGPNVKCFPCAGRSTDRMQGSYSALVFVVNVGTSNTDLIVSGTDYVGEIFIGSADGSGSSTYGMTSFTSRPAALKINYKYQPQGSETFTGEIKIYSGQTVIAQAKFTDGAASGSWTSRTIPLIYSNTEVKATHAWLSFKATSAGNPSIDNNSKVEYNGGTYTGHFGSQLRLDNLQLIYE